jgi:para-nitrobenzyl esterase
VRDGEAARVPLLLGSNLDEWRLLDLLRGDALSDVTRAALLTRLGDDVLRIHAEYREARAGRPPAPGPARSADAEAWIDLIGDGTLRVPMLRLADAHARYAPVWMYRFDWATPAFDGRLGATHMLELPFVWNQLELPDWRELLGGDVEGARPLCARMHEAWAAFIRDGAPAAAGLPAWPRYDEPRRATMVLDRESCVADDPDAALRERWSALPERSPSAPEVLGDPLEGVVASLQDVRDGGEFLSTPDRLEVALLQLTRTLGGAVRLLLH